MTHVICGQAAGKQQGRRKQGRERRGGDDCRVFATSSRPSSFLMQLRPALTQTQKRTETYTYAHKHTHTHTHKYAHVGIVLRT